MFPLFLKDPFFLDYLQVETAVVVRRGVGKSSPLTSILCYIFSYSDPSGILSSDGKQNTA